MDEGMLEKKPAEATSFYYALLYIVKKVPFCACLVGFLFEYSLYVTQYCTATFFRCAV